MTKLSLTVNGAACQADVEPRTHLADFLRHQVGLTGTHLGCEQGVCGACTILIDGQPMRSCLPSAVSCEGADIRTIEGFDGDELMAALREAFSVHHGLQCGFCTPGMLVTARDIILRYGDADEATIRRELSGNICRCTGYMGIVAAIRAVAAGRQAMPPAGRVVVAQAAPPVDFAKVVAVAPASAAQALGTQISGAAPMATLGADGPVLRQSLEIATDIDQLWLVLADTARVATCLPGASVSRVDGNHIEGQLSVKFGPIKASFAGEAEISRDDAAKRGRILGQGRDAKGGSSAKGEVGYALRSLGESRTAIDIEIRYRLTGALAQFGRSELVADFAGRMADSFAANLSAMLNGASVGADAPQAEINLLAMLWSVLKQRLARLFGG